MLRSSPLLVVQFELGLKVLAFGSASNCGWLQTRPALVRAGISRFSHCPRIFPYIEGIRCPLRPRSDVCRAMADGLSVAAFGALYRVQLPNTFDLIRLGPPDQALISLAEPDWGTPQIDSALLEFSRLCTVYIYQIAPVLQPA